MNPNGLSLPVKKEPAAPAAGSAAITRQPTPEAGDAAPRGGGDDGGKGPQTVEQLNDALGAAGLDIEAEEKQLRETDRLRDGADLKRIREQDFIETAVMADVVRQIAAKFDIKKLEAQTIDLLALAVRQRLLAILNDAVAARNHRTTATHHRPPPLAPLGKRRRRGEDDDSEDEDDELPEEFGGKGALNGKGKNKDPLPAWDQLVFDEQEKILAALERVDREEERRARRARNQRDAREEEDRRLAEQIAREREENGELAPATADSGAAKLTAGQSAGETGNGKQKGKSAAGGSTPGAGGDETPKPKKKKAGPGGGGAKGGTKLPSEDMKKKLTDQVAMRSLGGAKFSWLNAGAAAADARGPGAAAGGGLSSLPPPKFAPGVSLAGGDSPAAGGSSLPPPSFAPAVSSGLNPSSRLAMTPALHEANRKRAAEEDWNKGKRVIELDDLLWAMERERGLGSGKGSGVTAATKARAGVIADKIV